MEKERWKGKGKKCKKEELWRWEEERRREENGRRSEGKEEPRNKQTDQLAIGICDTITLVRLHNTKTCRVHVSFKGF